MKLDQRQVAGCTVLLAGIFAAPAAWGAGFQNSAQSATSTALGGTGVANVDEPNSSFYNPAAMMSADGFRIYGGPTLIIPGVEYEGEGTSASTERTLVPPPNAHVGMTFERLAVGVGVTFPYGLTIEWPEDWEGREIVERQALTTVDVNPNVAYSVFEDLAVSAGLQVVTASVELERDQQIRSDRDVEVELAGSGFGVGATLGALYRPTPNWSFGANYRSAVRLDFEGRARFEGEEETPFAQTFVDQDVTTHITTPHTFVTGISWADERVRYTFDVGYTTWSTYDSLDVEYSRSCDEGAVGCDPSTDATNPPTSRIDADWFDVIALRAGFEYRALPQLPLRVGAAYDLSPIPEETVSPSLPGNDRAVGSAGLGYVISGFRADLGYQFVYTTRTIDNGNQDGDYTTTAHVVGINVGYGFGE